MDIERYLLEAKRCHQAGDLERAELLYRKALGSQPENAGVLYELGSLLQDRGLYDEAVRCYRKVTELEPGFPGSYFNIGVILKERGAFDEAVSNYRKALELAPDSADIHNNIGLVLLEEGLFDEAVQYFLKAVEMDPLMGDAFNNLGLAHKNMGELDEALRYYDKALQIDPGNAEIHFGLSIVCLLGGDLRKGWEEYEWRWGTEDFAPYIRDFPHPVWDGSPLKGRSIFVYSEQGVGDEIMFASCLPELLVQSETALVECDKRLVPLFERSFPGAEIVERVRAGSELRTDVAGADLRVAIGSLPRHFRPDLGAFHGRKDYLVPDPRKVEMWRRRYGQLGDGMKIGISWRGGSKRRRLIQLDMWERLFSMPGTRFINLQYGDCAGELRELRERYGRTVYDWEDADPLKDLDNFAAQTAALDLVISVDNATVHMAGALGVPVWTVLGYVPDWRWMLGRTDSPWYPTMRLFRQREQGLWKAVMEEVAGELRKTVDDR